MLIHTTKGLVDFEQLQVKDVTELHDNARVTATEWYLGDELVRRDVHVNILRGQSALGEGGSFHG